MVKRVQGRLLGLTGMPILCGTQSIILCPSPPRPKSLLFLPWKQLCSYAYINYSGLFAMEIYRGNRRSGGQPFAMEIIQKSTKERCPFSKYCTTRTTHEVLYKTEAESQACGGKWVPCCPATDLYQNKRSASRPSCKRLQ